MSATTPVLEVRDLTVHFPTTDGLVKAVDGVSFTVAPRERLGVVGESGSGKSVTFLTIMGLITRKHARVGGEVLFKGENILDWSQEEKRQVRGKGMAMVFQDPMTSLHPFYRVGGQIAEAILAHEKVSKTAARARAVDMLRTVGIPRPETRANQYPHEYSGGMRQRAMIAMALVLNPDVLIADEPTTALDVTVQAQILDLVDRLKDEFDTAVIMITHDLGVVAEHTDRVQVMYAGKVIEEGMADTIYHGAHHPYTWGLMQSISRVDEQVERLKPIRGMPPSLIHVPSGCAFHPRCPYAFAPCPIEVPALREEGFRHRNACHLPVEDKKRIFAEEVVARS